MDFDFTSVYCTSNYVELLPRDWLHSSLLTRKKFILETKFKQSEITFRASLDQDRSIFDRHSVSLRLNPSERSRHNSNE